MAAKSGYDRNRSRVSARTILQLGDAISQDGLLFHGRNSDERLLVLRKGIFYERQMRIDEHTAAAKPAGGKGTVTDGLDEASRVIKQSMIGLNRPIVLPNSFRCDTRCRAYACDEQRQY